jgi:hypothetical protein
MSKDACTVTAQDVLRVMLSYGAGNWEMGGLSLEDIARNVLPFLDIDEIEDPSICGFEDDSASYSPSAEIGRQLMFMGIWRPRWEYGQEMPTLTSYPVPAFQLEFNRRLGMVTESGVVFEVLTTPVNWMSFILLIEPHTTDKQLKAGASQLRRRFGPIGQVGMARVSFDAVIPDIHLPN